MFFRHSFLASTAIVLSLGLAAPAVAQVRTFDIPAQAAVKAIPELARQAQIEIIASARDLTGVRTPAITPGPVRDAMSARNRTDGNRECSRRRAMTDLGR
jgi:hypothetical protein